MQDIVRQVSALAREAVLRDEAWSEVLGLLSSAANANGGVIFVPAIGPTAAQALAVSGVDKDAFAEYIARWAPHDAWWLSAMSQGIRFVPGMAAFGHEVLPLSQLRRTVFYSDYTRKVGYDSVAALMVAGGGPHMPPWQLSLHRSPGQLPFEEETRQLLAAVWPALKEAAEASWKLKRLRRTDLAVEMTLAILPQPIWVLQSDLTITYANPAACHAMVQGTWVLSDIRRLRQIGFLNSSELERLMNPRSDGPNAMVVSAFVDGMLQCATLRWVPITEGSSLAAAWPSASTLVSLELPAARRMDIGSTLVQRFRLTAAEARVAERLIAAQQPQQIAEGLSVSVSTVRTHTRAIYQKIGCRRQTELMALTQLTRTEIDAFRH